jgi:phosphoribosylformylglycinamidine synthase
MAEACRALDFPIVSGNVSLYNESKATGGGSAILPTPAIGGVGLIQDWRKAATIAFKAEEEAIVRIGGGWGELGQSLWLREIHGREEGPPPPVNLRRERLAGETVRRLIADGLVTAVHDVSDGGLAVAVAEMALASGIGAEFDEVYTPGLTSTWFGEDQGSYVVTTSDYPRLREALEGRVAYSRIGTTGCLNRMTGGQSLFWRITAPNNRAVETGFDAELDDLARAHESFFKELMGGDLTIA